ncbi:MAG: ABC transporter permease [Bryobacteraceae bacterium]|nr:ABC transporter permease [Bryobacteraceae bacterium]
MRWRRKERERDLDREIEADLELEAAEQRDRGLFGEEARYAARRAFGNTAMLKEDTRESWGWTALERLLQDIRYALRTMRRSPGFTTIAVLSLALGIGANTAIFTFVNAALLKPLPYPNADRIVALLQRPLKGDEPAAVSPRSFVPWHDRARSFEALAIAQSIPVNTQGADGAEQVPGLWATPELFRVFGVQPMLGRLFTGEEGLNREAIRRGLAGTNSVVVLSHGYWQRRFGADPNILEKTIPLERGAATVIGVLPPGFQLGSQQVDLYLPVPLDRARPEAIGSRAFHCFGLLRPGVTLDAARAEMQVLAAEVGRQDPIEKDWGVVVLSLRDYFVRDNRVVLFVLLGVVVLVLLIACANLAGLLLTRGIGRRNELALRASLGAGRGRLLQQLLIESLVLSAMGGALGLLLGSLASRALVILAQDAVAFGQIAGASLDARVLVFTVVLSLLTAVVFGLAPASQVSRFDLQAALREQGRGTSDSRGQQRLRSALVVGEVALAAVLLAGAGLLLQTFAGLLQVKLGFQPANVLTMRIFVTGDAVRRSNLVEGVLDRIRTLPEVRAVGAIQFLPLTGFTNNWVFRFAGRPEPVGTEQTQADGSTVSHGYFAAMGIPILRGRDFDKRDHLNSPPVALVNESFVRKYCRNEEPIGQRIVGDWANSKPAEIVGVVGDIRQTALAAEPRPTIFLAQAQTPGYITYLVARTQSEPQRLAAAVRRAVQQVDPNQPVTAVQPMEQYVSTALAKPRLYGVLVGTFAALALLLAAIGVYGLMAYSVSRRTHEIGIRLALGAQRQEVLFSILGQGIRLMLIGLALGLACAVALSRFVANLLYGISAADPGTYAAVAILLGGISLAAAYVPALRASRVNPMTALRYE